jgi:hypothetical protein
MERESLMGFHMRENLRKQHLGKEQGASREDFQKPEPQDR